MNKGYQIKKGRNSDGTHWEDEYLNGVIHGASRRYNAQGFLAFEYNYKNGVLDGNRRVYWSSGKLRFTALEKTDPTTNIHYLEGETAELQYKDSLYVF